ncbi:amino acid aminotransferase [Halomonas sp. 25-S5]|uniref:amino acid aminotransferase n=1 Tax=Halomonas sp. 25-S5 TaxID=2994065 RepID=UPI00246933A7|nr:amino acid aminotransferase [Halomonas sp. 25-S5]
MFENIEWAPEDSILGLVESFKKDCNSRKIDLGVGIYKDEQGNSPVMHAVKKAETWLIHSESTKAYISAHGNTDYCYAVMRLVLGGEASLIKPSRVSITQTPGGTGALRVAAELIARKLHSKKVWVPDPTWANHPDIFPAAGLELGRYPYVGVDGRMDFEGMIDSIKHMPEGDVLLLHACCHNPTGFDLSRSQWREVFEVVKARRLLPLIDFAYQGFGSGLDDDAYCVRLMAENLSEVIITHSCSKSFGIYRERTGSLMVVAGNSLQANSVRSQVALIVRQIYSNPPSHGSLVVSEILKSSELSSLWREELDSMRSRIQYLRQLFLEAMSGHGLENKFRSVIEQRGMFSYTGLSPAQVRMLRDNFSVYMVNTGRVNMAGMSQDNIPYLAKAIASVS